MIKFCVELDFNFPILKNIPLPRVRHYQLASSAIINKEAIDIFYQKKVYVPLVEVFYSEPFFKSSIHIDGKGGDYVKLNVIRGGEGSVMSWYSIKPHEKKESLINDIGAVYSNYSLDEVELRYSKSVNTSCVQVGIPHGVINYEEERWCVGIVLRDINLGNRITMEQAVLLFDEYILKN